MTLEFKLISIRLDQKNDKKFLTLPRKEFNGKRHNDNLELDGSIPGCGGFIKQTKGSTLLEGKEYQLFGGTFFNEKDRPRSGTIKISRGSSYALYAVTGS